MHRYFFRAVLFLLASTQVLTSYEGSSASQLASMEPEPSALICGCVHAVTGDFLFQQPDMVVKGAQAIAIPRKYYSSCHEASIEDQILPHRKAFGWGIPDFIHITRLSIPEPSGMVFTYIQHTQRAYRPLKGGFQAGITGYLFDYLGNRYHPANNRAYWPNDTTLLVYTSTGEVRVYEKTKFANSQPECQFEFRLSRLRLSNGTFIDYEYKKDHLKSITALSAAQKGQKFSKAKFSEKTDRLLIKGSDKSTLEYGYKAYKRKLRGQKHKVKLLKYVASSLYPSEKLKREKKSIRIQERHFDHGRSLSCEYHKSGQAAKLTGPQGTLATIAYENGETSSLDRDGNKTTYHYNPKTLRIDKIHYYQGANTPLKTETYTWNIFGCLEQKTIASGDGEILLAIQCKYNNHLDLIEKRATSGQEYAIYYDYNDRFLLSEEREDNGNRTTYTYLQNANLPEEICTYKNNQLLKRIRYRYNEDLLLIEEIIDSGDNGYHFTKTIKRKQEKPLYGMPEETSKYCNERLIEKTTLLYDELGNITKQKHYGSDGKLQTTNQTIYNEKSQIIKEIDPEGNTTEHRYDESGNHIWEKTPLGLEIHSTYDTANRLIEERQTSSEQTLITRYQDFDPLDHPTKIIDPLGSMTHRKYNALGYLIQETNPEGHTTSYTHDALGNILSIKDPLGNTTTTTYNSYSQPLCITHPDRSRITYTYHPDGTKASYTNETDITTHYTYDIFQNLSSEEIANGPKKTWTYDAFHLLEETNLDGYTIAYEYDTLGRKSKETYEGRTTHYTYDPLSRVTSEQTGNLRIERTYNKQSHITSEKTYDGNELTYQIQTTYNHNGSPLEVTTYPNNQPAITKTTYDTFGRQTSHTTPLGHQTKTTYQITDGKKTITTHEMGGITQTTTYNTLDQPICQERTDTSGKLLSKTDYTYDPSGNLIKQTTDTHTIEWTYDSRHRKITETESDQKTTHYTYYLDSTLQTLTKPDGTTLSYTYNKLGHLRNLHSSKGDIHYTYTYNNQGHLLLSKDLIHQTQTKRIVDPHGHILEETLANGLHLKSRYDELGRKTQLTLPDKTITYTHTGTNLASVTIDDKTHSYTYDQSNNLIQEKHIDGSTTEYTYDLNNRLIKAKHPHLEEILQYDPRGNLVQITRNKEKLLYTYDPLDHLTCEPRHTYLYDPLHVRHEVAQILVVPNNNHKFCFVNLPGGASEVI